MMEVALQKIFGVAIFLISTRYTTDLHFTFIEILKKLKVNPS
jgi:hypothetical protein